MSVDAAYPRLARPPHYKLAIALAGLLVVCLFLSSFVTSLVLGTIPSRISVFGLPVIALVALPKRGQEEATAAEVKCIGCGETIAPSIAHLGSLHCHDCRDAQPLTAAKVEVFAA